MKEQYRQKYNDVVGVPFSHTSNNEFQAKKDRAFAFNFGFILTNVAYGIILGNIIVYGLAAAFILWLVF